jgi:DUF438 domain-containing protein
MSEHINNREYRKEMIKKMITQLHEGKTIDQVKGMFNEVFNGVSATEISEAEQALISEGLPVEEVQRLCDVHAAAFKGSIAEIHSQVDVSVIPGHPANTLKAENVFIQTLIDARIKPYLNQIDQPETKNFVLKALEDLAKIDIHYSKKENLMFPYLEKYGITAPPKVMWGVDDEVRSQLKEVRQRIISGDTGNEFVTATEELLTKITEMIYKEENILLPMLIEHLTQQEWKTIDDESAEIGHLVEKLGQWHPVEEKQSVVVAEDKLPGIITLPSGVFTTEELTHVLNALPFDITFVDKNDKVKYFSQGKERIFARTKAIIGREVSNCHPPASVHVVEQIVADLKSGKKDHEDFWISMKGQYIFIRYFAVRDEQGEYLGVLEVTQNIKPLQEITGEKRLVSQ